MSDTELTIESTNGTGHEATRPPARRTIILGVPHRGDGSIDGKTARAAYLLATRDRHNIVTVATIGSAGIMNFNTILCTAINGRHETKADYLAMLHADVGPPPWWLDTMVAIAEEHDADLLSAFVRIKDHSGVFSTAMSNPADDWNPWCRLTARQVWHEDFPETFDAGMARRALANLPDDLRDECPAGSLLEVNNGCMLYRLSNWNPTIYFETRDRLTWRDGCWTPQFLSEDWIFSRMVAEAGGRVMATRKLVVSHRGDFEFASDVRDGWPRDENCLRIRGEWPAGPATGPAAGPATGSQAEPQLEPAGLAAV